MIKYTLFMYIVLRISYSCHYGCLTTTKEFIALLKAPIDLSLKRFFFSLYSKDIITFLRLYKSFILLLKASMK